MVWAIGAVCSGLVAILGLHGLYAHVHWLDYFGEELLGVSPKACRLFLVIPMIEPMKSVVHWISYEAIYSWYIPALFTIVGIVLTVICVMRVSRGTD